MKAITLVKTGDAQKAFEIKEVPTPTPKDNEVLVKVEAFGLNFADVMARRGLYQDAPPIPCVLGYEVVGHVEALGKDVKSLTVGQRVLAFTRFGGYAEYAVTDARAVVGIPDDMDKGLATALATQYCTAWFCAEEMVQLHEGDHVLVQAAAGGVGTALVQLAKRKKCVVYGTAGSDEKIDFLKKEGVDVPINYRKEDFYEIIHQKLGKRGLDVVFDAVGGETFRKGKKLLGNGGRMVTFGAAERVHSASFIAGLKMMWAFGLYLPLTLLMKSQAIIGVNMLRIADNRTDTLQRCMQEVVRLAVSNEIKPYVGAEYHVDDIDKAHALLESRQSKGKVVVCW